MAWNGSLAAGQTGVTIGFRAEVVEVEPGEEIVNVAWIDDGVEAVLQRQATIRRCARYVYACLTTRGR